MRADRDRTKKLTLAFHFLSSDQAAWECEKCRKAGLERRRRCGFLGNLDGTPERAVWARGRIVATSCPKSQISPQSAAWVEEFFAWKLFGSSGYRTLEARKVDAFALLESEIRAQGEART